MTIGDISSIAGIASMVISGALFVVLAVSRVFWNLTFKKLETEVLELKKNTALEKENNESFRHKHKASVEGLAEVIKIKFEDFDKQFSHFQDLMVTKIDLAISKNNESKR